MRVKSRTPPNNGVWSGARAALLDQQQVPQRLSPNYKLVSTAQACVTAQPCSCGHATIPDKHTCTHEHTHPHILLPNNKNNVVAAAATCSRPVLLLPVSSVGLLHPACLSLFALVSAERAAECCTASLDQSKTNDYSRDVATAPRPQVFPLAMQSCS